MFQRAAAGLSPRESDLINHERSGNRSTGIPGLILAVSLLGFVLSGCSNDDTPPPATVSITIGAPTLASPASGSDANEEQPTLVVGNAMVSDGSIPSYAFQIATDPAFNEIVAQADGIAQGTGGQTSWMVSTALGPGQHFWRARAGASGIDGPYSQVAELTVIVAFKSNEPRGGVLVYDPLTTGSTVGEIRGGEFTDQGWKVVAQSNYIAYDLPTIESGFFEVDITNLKSANEHGDARHLFHMWDPQTSSDLTRNPYRVTIQKHSRRSTGTKRFLRMRWISGGQQYDVSNSFIGWEPGTVYHFRLEWGQEGDGLAARLLMNDREMFFLNYRRPYRPLRHRLELGAASRAESPEEAIYSNVRIGTR